MKKLILLILSLVVIVALVFAGIALTNYFENKQASTTVYNSNVIYNTTYDVQNRYACLHNDLIITTTTGTSAINASGKVLWQVPTSCSNPKLQVAGDYILVADINGSNLYVIKNKKLAFTKTLSDKIYNAQINKNGYVAVSTTADGYSSKVSVMSNSGDEIYYYGISNDFAIDAIVSPNNKNLAVATYGSENGQIIGGVAFANLGSQTITSNPTFTNLVISNVEYMSNGDLLAIGDTAALYYDNKGKNLWTYKYQNQVLSSFISGGTSGISLLFNNSVGTQTYKFINSKGSESESKDLDFIPKQISGNINNSIITGDRKFITVSKTGNVSLTFNLSKDFSSVSFAENGRYFYGISGDNIELVKI